MKRLFTSKKAVELSVNMLVVIILGIVLFGTGITIFYNTYNKVADFNDQVDTQTQNRLNALLDDGSPIVVLKNTQDASRGDAVTFTIAINNNLGSTKGFKVQASYAGTTADYGAGNDPFNPSSAIGGASCDSPPESCGNAWILGRERTFTLENNEREMFPLRITIPKKDINRGQYIFNVDVCYVDEEAAPNCDLSNDNAIRFSSRQKLYITIN